MTDKKAALEAFNVHMRQVLIGYKHSPIIEHAETIRTALNDAPEVITKYEWVCNYQSMTPEELMKRFPNGLKVIE